MDAAAQQTNSGPVLCYAAPNGGRHRQANAMADEYRPNLGLLLLVLAIIALILSSRYLPPLFGH